MGDRRRRTIARSAKNRGTRNVTRRRRAESWGSRGAIAAAGLALALAACSGDFAPPRLDLRLTNPDLNMFAKSEARARPIAADDLIGPGGRCAGEPEPAVAPQALNFTAGPEAGRPAQANPAPPAPAGAPAAAPLRRGIALGMTECDVVRAIGHTDRIDISTDERGQRTVVLTYQAGERPGVYRFVGGQLASIERTNEPAPGPAAKPKKANKKQTPS